MPVVAHLDGLETLVAELADVAAHRDATEPVAGLLLDEEAGDALLGACRERNEPGADPVGHPRLRPGDHILIAVAFGTTAERTSVAAGVGFGERQRTAHQPAGQLREEAGLLRVGPRGADKVGHHDVGVQDS